MTRRADGVPSSATPVRGAGIYEVVRWVVLVLLMAPAGRVGAFGFEGRPKWKGTPRPITFVINMAHVPATISQEQYVAFLKDALKPWADVDTADLQVAISEEIIRDADANQPQADGVNMILWNSGAVPKSAMTWGRAYPFEKECDILVELTTPFTLANIRNTLTHEFGHCLGLAHSTAMASMARYSHYLVGLTQDDRAAVSIVFPNDARPLRETTATLTGRVVTGAGDALVGAVLSVSDRVEGRVAVSGFSGLVDQQRRRDASGAFELPGIPPGEHYQLLLQPMDMYGGIQDGHHGAPANDTPRFRPVAVELPALKAGEVKPLGKLIVETLD